VVPPVDAAADLPGVLAADTSAVRLLLTEPALASPADSLRDLDAWLTGAASVLLLVGPEGGWTAGEVETAQARGCRLVALGGRTLRADAAPLVALSVILHRLGDI
jgi:16S rRNA (uracil1498-N3)-methyltransferase